MVVKFALSNLVRSLNDCVGNFGLESIVSVGLSSSLLEETKSTDDRKRHALSLATYLEVLERSLSLSTPVLVPWHLNGAKGVFLLAVLAGGEHSEKASLAAEHLSLSSDLERLLGQHSYSN
jgi:hypothetical protein